MADADAEIYNENVRAFLNARKDKDIPGFVIQNNGEGTKSPSWDTWRHYFKKIGHERMLTIMHAHEKRAWIGKNGVTVPTEWPIDFDPTAPKLVVAYKPPNIEGLTAEQRAEVVRKAMTNAGFVPKEYRHGKPVSPDMLVGEARQRRQAEIAAELAKVDELAKQPLPALSEAAKALFSKGSQ